MDGHWFSVSLQTHFDAFAAKDRCQQYGKQKQRNFYGQRIQIEITCFPVRAIRFKNIIPKFDALPNGIGFCYDSLVCYIQIIVRIIFYFKNDWISIRQWISAMKIKWKQILNENENQLKKTVIQCQDKKKWKQKKLREFGKICIKLSNHIDNFPFGWTFAKAFVRCIRQHALAP